MARPSGPSSSGSPEPEPEKEKRPPNRKKNSVRVRPHRLSVQHSHNGRHVDVGVGTESPGVDAVRIVEPQLSKENDPSTRTIMSVGFTQHKGVGGEGYYPDESLTRTPLTKHGSLLRTLAALLAGLTENFFKNRHTFNNINTITTSSQPSCLGSLQLRPT